MRLLLVLACIAGCTADSEIEIVSPKSGDLIPTTGDVTLVIDGQEVQAAGGITVTINATAIATKSTTFDYGTCDECRFNVVFSAAGFSPITQTIRVALEYDLSDIASDEVTVNFVSP